MKMRNKIDVICPKCATELKFLEGVSKAFCYKCHAKFNLTKIDLGEMSDEFKNCNSLSGSNISIGDIDNFGERLPDYEYEGLENPIWDK